MTTYATAPSGALPGETRKRTTSVVTTANQKGGVGKTMVTLALADHTAAATGPGRVLVVDVDPQATAHDLVKVMQDPGFDVMHELDPVQLTHIRELRGYDAIFVDCPGSLDGSMVLDRILARSTFVIIPYNHEPESVLPTIRTARRVGDALIPHAAVVTMADPRLGAEHILDAWRTLESEKIPHFRSVIRSYRAWPNSLKAGVPLSRWNERYAPKLREDISSLHTELVYELTRRGLMEVTR